MISSSPTRYEVTGVPPPCGANPVASDESPFPRRSPRLIGRYVLCDAFARGGMATIHLARLLGEGGFTRTVAVKHLYPHLSADACFVAMFLEEARLLSRVRHPNVVAPLDIIAFDAELFIAMEYVHGQPVSFLCNAHRGPIPPRLASAILTQVLLGLHAVHEATSETGHPLGIVHRDVSPQNILVDGDGIARLIDFGIAKAAGRAQTLSTARGLLKGKLGYLAPEQLREQRVDRRTDIYMAGIVLWELLTGQRLFGGDTPSAMFEALAADSITPPSALVPDLPAALNAVVLRALAPNKEQRFESARAMATALAQAAPPAATIELGAWVEPLAGTELRKRAQRIAELETLALGHGPFQAPGRCQIPLTTTARMEDTSRVTPPEHATQQMESRATPAVEPIRTEVIPRPELAEEPAPRRFKSGLLYVGLSMMLAVGVLASAFVWSVTGETEQTPSETHAETTFLDRSIIASPVPEPPLPIDDPMVIPGPSVEPAVRPEPPVAEVQPPSRAKVRGKGPNGAAQAGPPLDCSVPYRVDERGIKRFKAACF